MKYLLLSLTILSFSAFGSTGDNCFLKGKWAVYYTSDMFKSVNRVYKVDSLEDCLNKIDQLFHSETRVLIDYDTEREFTLHLRYVKYKYYAGEFDIVKGRVHNNVTEW